MIYPWQLTLALTKYVASNKLHGRHQFPLVLMLEPTFRCNLACAGCGRIRESQEMRNATLSVEECLAAVDEAGAPVVCLTGGEPLLHPGIQEIVDGLVARRRFVYLATNGLLAGASLNKFKPSPYLSFVFHLDGLAGTHDHFVSRSGVFDTAIAGIKAAKAAGFQVRTNTTVYKGTDWREIRELFGLVSDLGVDGIMIAPAFSYEAVGEDIFLSRDEAIAAFQPMYRERKKYRLYNTPIYMEFLAGKRALHCTPWSTPTRNPNGWKQPCYLLTDGYCSSYAELMETTPWESYGMGNDPRCTNCMVHSGFEASALDAIGSSLSDLWHMVAWNFFS
jgi:hopanoid biosynthesis associated radical SAM protein HpnH